VDLSVEKASAAAKDLPAEISCPATGRIVEIPFHADPDGAGRLVLERR
jgi:hypothetical protein